VREAGEQPIDGPIGPERFAAGTPKSASHSSPYGLTSAFRSTYAVAPAAMRLRSLRAWRSMAYFRSATDARALPSRKALERVLVPARAWLYGEILRRVRRSRNAGGTNWLPDNRRDTIAVARVHASKKVIRGQDR
jgi:hypothetical protein